MISLNNDYLNKKQGNVKILVYKITHYTQCSNNFEMLKRILHFFLNSSQHGYNIDVNKTLFKRQREEIKKTCMARENLNSLLEKNIHEIRKKIVKS